MENKLVNDESIQDNIFIQDSEEKDSNKKINNPPTAISIFFNKNKIWIIIILVMIISIIVLSLSLYFVNRKCNSTVKSEREKFEKDIEDYNNRIKTHIDERNKYINEAQELRSEMRLLLEENQELKGSMKRNKLVQKKLLEEELSKKKSHKGTDSQSIIPNDILSKQDKTAVTINELDNTDTIITQKEIIPDDLIET